MSMYVFRMPAIKRMNNLGTLQFLAIILKTLPE